MIAWWIGLIIGVVCLLVGFVVGFLVIKHVFEKQLKDNPPVNRDMIRAMYSQMGRKPSERDITKVMEAMNKYQ